MEHTNAPGAANGLSLPLRLRFLSPYRRVPVDLAATIEYTRTGSSGALAPADIAPHRTVGGLMAALANELASDPAEPVHVCVERSSFIFGGRILPAGSEPLVDALGKFLPDADTAATQTQEIVLTLHASLRLLPNPPRQVVAPKPVALPVASTGASSSASWFSHNPSTASSSSSPAPVLPAFNAASLPSFASLSTQASNAFAASGLTSRAPAPSTAAPTGLGNPFSFGQIPSTHADSSSGASSSSSHPFAATASPSPSPPPPRFPYGGSNGVVPPFVYPAPTALPAAASSSLSSASAPPSSATPAPFVRRRSSGTAGLGSSAAASAFSTSFNPTWSTAHSTATRPSTPSPTDAIQSVPPSPFGTAPAADAGTLPPSIAEPMRAYWEQYRNYYNDYYRNYYAAQLRAILAAHRAQTQAQAAAAAAASASASRPPPTPTVPEPAAQPRDAPPPPAAAAPAPAPAPPRLILNAIVPPSYWVAHLANQFRDGRVTILSFFGIVLRWCLFQWLFGARGMTQATFGLALAVAGFLSSIGLIAWGRLWNEGLRAAIAMIPTGIVVGPEAPPTAAVEGDAPAEQQPQTEAAPPEQPRTLMTYLHESASVLVAFTLSAIPGTHPLDPATTAYEQMAAMEELEAAVAANAAARGNGAAGAGAPPAAVA
ncbi:hypothetical protein H9P43_002410 [Blastocladiella emersonii ATCC 22665]|nr:hypothetical protein H9P43_002410 [Blastocladiella emersonii ATCC 22665]